MRYPGINLGRWLEQLICDRGTTNLPLPQVFLWLETALAGRYESVLSFSQV